MKRMKRVLHRRDRAKFWLHRCGVHWFCRVRVVPYKIVDHIDFSSEYVAGKDGETLDVTTFGGRPVYATAYRIGHGPRRSQS